MEKIIEQKGYFGNKYIRMNGNNKYEVNVAGITKEYNDITYMMVVSTYGRVYFETYKYLNGELENETRSKRELALRALKFLYSYIELFNTDLKHLDIRDKNRLITFLRGGQGAGQYISYDLKTFRKNDTINNYFGVYRSFCRYIGVTENIFNGTSGKKIIKGTENAFTSKANSIEVQTYSMQLKEIESKIVPKYISYTEYLNIVKLIEDRYTIREKIIVKLMYEYGLRIGEVLGLTLEDVQGEEITKQKDNYRLIIRNRFTDRSWQHAKSCLKVQSRNTYNREDYYENNNGFQIVYISLITYNLIQEYIEEVTSPFTMSETAYNNYKEKNVADKVSQINIERNAYIFISKNYTPISGGGWNKIMKQIFQEVGLKIDKGKKRDNLNHRFRHGYAMFKVLNEGFDELKLAHVMRHSNTKSVSKYFNPTEEDLIDFAIKQDELTKRGLHL